MIRIDRQRTAGDLLPAINRVFELSAQKIRSIEESWRPENGSPVFTVAGVYKSRGWTEWTQGFQFGAPLLQFDATCELGPRYVPFAVLNRLSCAVRPRTSYASRPLPK